MAAPLTVLMNSFRIGMIGVLVNSYGIGQAEGFLHFFEGWVIFGACIAILFLMAIALQRLTPNPLPLSDTIDLDTEGFAAQMRRGLGIVPARGLIVAALLSLAVGAAFVLAPPPSGRWWTATPSCSSRATSAPGPASPKCWTRDRGGAGGRPTTSTPPISPRAKAAVNLFAAWYESQTEGEGLHSPEVCLPVGGWEVFSIDPTPVSIPDTVYGDFTVNRAVIQKGLSKQLVYYWFEQRGQRMTNDYAAKVSVV